MPIPKPRKIDLNRLVEFVCANLPEEMPDGEDCEIRLTMSRDEADVVLWIGGCNNYHHSDDEDTVGQIVAQLNNAREYAGLEPVIWED
jgi:hypothetical protein